MVHRCSTPEKEGQKGRRQKRKNETKTNMRSGRSPCPEGARLRLLFAGAISPILCPVDGPTEGRHDKNRRKTTQEKKRNEKNTRWHILYVSFFCPPPLDLLRVIFFLVCDRLGFCCNSHDVLSVLFHPPQKKFPSTSSNVQLSPGSDRRSQYKQHLTKTLVPSRRCSSTLFYFRILFASAFLRAQKE